MNICYQCDQEIEGTSHCAECTTFNDNEYKDYVKLLESEHADLCEQNARLHAEVDQLEEDKESIQTELDDLRFEIANT
jgi:SMC interacting uncharacterized protein involved in chromosome segregation